jgi:TDG/mug DNA glycosylase family protein
MLQTHPFDPIIDEDSEVLVLGSFPSIKSFENNFYYAHPRNQFWPIMEALFSVTLTDNEAKRALAKAKHIAMWDVYGALVREAGNSSDANLKELQPNDLAKLLGEHPKIRHVFCTGRKSYDGFVKHFSHLGLPVTLLPSTSPAHAAMTFDEKLERYRIIKETLEGDH